MDIGASADQRAHVVASCPGRVRVHMPALYRSEQEKRRIEACARQHEGIEAVHANPLTGRVLILFRTSMPVRHILLIFGIRAETSTPGVDSEKPDGVPPRTSQAAQAKARRDIYPDWHLRSAGDIIAFHNSSTRNGLSRHMVQERLRQGPNVLPGTAERSSLDILLGQFRSLPVLLLGASAVLSVLTGGLAEGLAIAAVLAMNAGIGFVTERRAESTIASLSELVDNVVPVMRDGRFEQAHASEIVRGDLLILGPGVRIAADARLAQVLGIAVDESALTGESRPVDKQVEVLENDVPLAERSNMVYMGTAVTAGTGLAVVAGTGANTEIGRIQTLMERTEQPKTPIQKELDRLGNQLVVASIGVCAGVFAIGLLRGFGWLQMLKSSVSLAIAAVPEGLPTVATTSLARSIRHMKTRQMLVRRLQAVETLGAIHTICLDKTGTLTMNRMSVVEVSLNGARREVRNGTLRGCEAIAGQPDDPSLSRFLQVCVLCNETEVRHNGDATALNGSATENALVELALSTGVDFASLRRQYPLRHASLRSDDRNYMSTVRAVPGAARYLVAVKGSPGDVLALCTSLLSGGRVTELTDTHRMELLAQNRQLAERQLRVLGFAYAESDSADVDATSGGLVWIGLAGLADPLRAGAGEVIAALHRAGVRTAMVTGDQCATARAIGRSLHLHNGHELKVLETDHLARIEPHALKSLVTQADIFARVSPVHKLEIVRALQASGEVVAMTGDGINDGPALQASDVGIAMGLHGTDLARSAADVVLEDDRLETVLEAIREGRVLTANIRKSLHFLISSNMSEILVVFGAVAAGAPSPLSPMQLLWVNLLGDVLPAIALAAEPPEGDVMEQPPREASKPLIGRDDLVRYSRESAFLSGGTFAAYLYGLARRGPGGSAGTIAFNALMLGQLLHALSCRSDRPGTIASTKGGHKLNMAIVGSIGLQLLANLVPGLRSLLGAAPMRGMDIVVALAGAGIPLLLNEAAKGSEQASRGSAA